MNYLEKIIKTCENEGVVLRLTRNQKTTKKLSHQFQYYTPKNKTLYKVIQQVDTVKEKYKGCDNLYTFSQITKKLISLSEKNGGFVEYIINGVPQYGCFEKDGFTFVIFKGSSIHVYK